MSRNRLIFFFGNMCTSIRVICINSTLYISVNMNIFDCILIVTDIYSVEFMHITSIQVHPGKIFYKLVSTHVPYIHKCI